jgi:O-methyltransferase domain/Dimerisation domain
MSAVLVKRSMIMQTPSLTPDRIVELGLAFRGAKALLSAAELGVFTALAHGPLDIDALRNRVGVEERGARDFFDALVALGMLDRDEGGRYANTPHTNLYLDHRKSTYIGGELQHFNTYVYPHWNSLTQALRTGKPQSGARASGHYPALYADPAALEILAIGMTGGALPVATALAAKMPWQNYRTVIDIGTAQGCLPVLIAQAHPHVAGGGFDLTPMKPLFDSYVEKHGLSHRLQFFAGDFLSDPLPTAEVLVLGRILHNWDLATKTLLLQKAYDALPVGGALVVYERLIDDERRTNAAGLLASLNMLIMTAGGFDFTGADCIGWMREAGFRDMSVEPLTSHYSMVVGFK